VVVTAAAKCLVVHGREQAFRQPEQKERRGEEERRQKYVAEELLFSFLLGRASGIPQGTVPFSSSLIKGPAKIPSTIGCG
jgi:hypothetical protein